MSMPARTAARVDPAAVAELVRLVQRNKAILDAVRLAQARLALARARLATPDPWGEAEPLVSVRIATFDRPALLIARAIASARRQTHRRLEIVVVGDHASPATAAALAEVDDARIRYHNLPARPPYPRFPKAFWATAGVHAMNAALDRCRGAWIAPLDDDDEFSDDHVEVLLAAARARRLEMVYGRMAAEAADGAWREIGREPLQGGQICHSAVLYSARLLCLRYDPFAWLEDDPGDWNLWKRMIAVGATIGFLPRVVGRHYAEHTSVSATDRAALYSRVASPEETLADVMATGGAHLLALA